MYRADLIAQFCNLRDLIALIGVSAQWRASSPEIARIIDALRVALSGDGMEYLAPAITYHSTNRGVLKCSTLPASYRGVATGDIIKRAIAQFARHDITRVSELIMMTSPYDRNETEVFAAIGCVIAANFDGASALAYRLDRRAIIAICVSLIVRGDALPAHITYIDDIFSEDRIAIKFAIEIFAECLATIADDSCGRLRAFIEHVALCHDSEGHVTLCRDSEGHFTLCDVYSREIDKARAILGVSRRVIEEFARDDTLIRRIAHRPIIATDIGSCSQYFAKWKYYTHLVAWIPTSSANFPRAVMLLGGECGRWKIYHETPTFKMLALIANAARNPDDNAIAQLYAAVMRHRQIDDRYWHIDIPWIVSMGFPCLYRIIERIESLKLPILFADSRTPFAHPESRLSCVDALAYMRAVLEHDRRTIAQSNARFDKSLRYEICAQFGDDMRELLRAFA